MSPISFSIEKKLKSALGRAGVIKTSNGSIETPAFVAVGTKATVKTLSVDELRNIGVAVVLSNTYHLYLEPGDDVVRKAGGLGAFMGWDGPTMTDSGGFQAFSLGVAYGKGIGKVSKGDVARERPENIVQMASIDDDGIDFTSVIDGSKHRFTPERSIEIQNNIGADIIFAFDECTSPTAPYEYQKEALERTHRWAARSLAAHNGIGRQALFGVVQGGRFQDLREESARVIVKMGFDGFGIGGSFEKKDLETSVSWVNTLLPENMPRHLLGIGEPEDLFSGVEYGVDLFDCVAPTRMARHGTLYTKGGKINITQAKFRRDFSPPEDDCGCVTCTKYTKAYISHLFRAREMLGARLASVHNLYFITHLVKRIRDSILSDNFPSFKENFLKRYISP